MELRENGDTTQSRGLGQKSYPGLSATAAGKDAWKRFYRGLACPGIFVMHQELTWNLLKSFG